MGCSREIDRRSFIAGVLALPGFALACDRAPAAPTAVLQATLPLSVASVSPTGGAVDSAVGVIIRGQGFRPGATVTIGRVATNVVVVDSTIITATTSPHVDALVAVVVNNPDGKTAALPDGYRYAALEVSRLHPSMGVSGETVRIVGAGFAPGATVTMGGVAALVFSSDDFSVIDVLAPEHPSGPVDVVVTNPSGRTVTLAGRFLFTNVGLSVSGNPVPVGGRLTISWTVPEQHRSEQWIVLLNVATGIYHWTYETTGAVSGTATLAAPAEAGEYEFQYRTWDDAGGFRILGRARVVVVPSAAHPGADRGSR